MIPQGMSSEQQPLVLNPLGLSRCDCGMRIVGARGSVPGLGVKHRAPTCSCNGSRGFMLFQLFVHSRDGYELERN